MLVGVYYGFYQIVPNSHIPMRFEQSSKYSVSSFESSPIVFGSSGTFDVSMGGDVIQPTSDWQSRKIECCLVFHSCNIATQRSSRTRGGLNITAAGF